MQEDASEVPCRHNPHQAYQGADLVSKGARKGPGPPATRHTAKSTSESWWNAKAKGSTLEAGCCIVGFGRERALALQVYFTIRTRSASGVQVYFRILVEGQRPLATEAKNGAGGEMAVSTAGAPPGRWVKGGGSAPDYRFFQ